MIINFVLTMKRLISYIGVLALLLLGGCQAEDFEEGWKPLAEDEVRLTFVVDSPVRVDVATRAGEASTESTPTVETLNLIILDKNNESSPFKRIKFSKDLFQVSESGISCITVKKRELASGLWLLFANADKILDDIMENAVNSIDAQVLLNYKGSQYDESADMNGFAKVSMMYAIHENLEMVDLDNPDDIQTLSEEPFHLCKPYAKVTIEQQLKQNNFLLTGFKLNKFSKYGSLYYTGDDKYYDDDDDLVTTQNFITSPLSASTLDKNGNTIHHASTNKSSGNGDQLAQYTYPLDNLIGTSRSEESMMIIRGHFEQVSEESDDATFDVNDVCYYAIRLPRLSANHHYRAIIEEATARGYNSPEEAMRYPGGLSVKFEDQRDLISNIVTNGRQVLAVNDTIIVSASETSATINIKTRMQEDDTNYKGKIKINRKSGSWATAGEYQDKDGDRDSKEKESDNGLATHYGEVTLTFLKNGGSEREAVFEISLDNTDLKREVVLIQSAPEDASINTIFDISLQIFEGNTLKAIISDYATFVREKNQTGGAGNLYGITAAENGERIRNHGLHMPMPNHDSGGGNVKYVYTVALKPDISGEAVISSEISPKVVRNSNTWTFTFEDGDDWTYKVYPDAFAFTLESGATFTLDMYHTGFFHSYNNEWYYYEVFTDNAGLHWLDRNLQAKSGGMSVRASNGEYLPSSIWPVNNLAGGDYLSPVGLDEERIPAGWRLPVFPEFQRIYAEGNFSTDIMATSGRVQYYAPSYKFTALEGTTRKTIRAYFPQNMQMVNNVLNGESQAGYYITKTPAGATDWYVLVQFLGLNSTSQNKNMGICRASARCVSGESTATTEKTYTCMVKGYTHVFIYYQNSNGTRSYLNKAWPGEQIAVYEDINRYHRFEYSTYANYNADRFMVVFNKVDDNGNVISTTGTGEGNRTGMTFRNNQYFDGSGISPVWKESL